MIVSDTHVASAGAFGVAWIHASCGWLTEIACARRMACITRGCVDRRETLNEFTYAPKLAGLDDIGSSLITLTVDLERYRANLRELAALAHPAKIIAVVKANAYGVGIAGLLPILSEFEDISLGVANADEALELDCGFWRMWGLFDWRGMDE